MGRKNLLYNYQALSSGDMTQASVSSNQTDLTQFDTITYKAKWTGGNTTNGNLTIETSDDGQTWDALDFGATINTDGATGLHRFIITEIGFKYARLTYARTNGSATGSLNVFVFGTNKGA